jgi:hypothetical protein
MAETLTEPCSWSDLRIAVVLVEGRVLDVAASQWTSLASTSNGYAIQCGLSLEVR